MFRLLPIVLCLASAALAADVKPADWPQWRGPNRDDNSPDKGLLKEWPTDGPPLAWKYAGIGEGYSSVAVAGDKVFTMGDVDGNCHVFALSRDKGEKLWSAKVGPTGRVDHPGARCTPTVDGDFVYAIDEAGVLVCLKAADGSEVWRKSLPGDLKGTTAHYSYTESPLIDGDKLVCTPGGRNAIVALDKKTSDVIWKSDINDTPGYSSVVVSNAGGVRQYVQLLSNNVVGVDAKDGKVLWKYTKLAQRMPVIPTPVVLGDQVFCSAGYGKGGAPLTLSADADGKFKVKEEYFSTKLTNKHGGVVQVGDYLYGDADDRGRPWCVEWKTGKVKDEWLKGASGKHGSGSASITYADGSLYVHYDNGYVVLVPATPDGYQEKGSFKIPRSSRQSWAHPVVVDGKLYLREQDTLYVYDVKAK